MARRAWNLCVGRIVALAATLVLSLLPAGQAPKIAGPCGKALCHCPAQVVEECGGGECHLAPVSQVLSFAPALTPGSEAPAIAWSSVFSAILTPAKIRPPAGVQGTSCEVPDGSAFALSEISLDLSTPPPRA